MSRTACMIALNPFSDAGVKSGSGVDRRQRVRFSRESAETHGPLELRVQIEQDCVILNILCMKSR